MENTMQRLIESIFSLSGDIRYAAVYYNHELVSSSRPGTSGASSSESDRYEELIVNPTLLTLVRQRGDIDCGGARYVLIRYGNFYQLVIPLEKGHVSICFEPSADPLNFVDPIRNRLSQNGLIRVNRRDEMRPGSPAN
jgi:hypothetical protein